jgi:hypothetical protein
VQIDGLPHEGTPLPQNALGRLLDEDRPDVVVANSLERWAWRRVHDVCHQRQVPTVLYVREDDSLGHIDSGAVPDALVANARSLADAMAAHGVRCAFVPSVVDTSRTQTTSTREAALAINPLPSRGSDLVWAIAQAAPEIPVVAQESWPLDGDELASVQRAVAGLANVQLRRAAPPGPGLYGDARVLLVPYRVDNRPRVIPEAQSNGIPVIAGDVPALTEAIGDGGLTVPLDSPAAWVDTLRGLWSDAAAYERLSAAALANSRRAEFDPDAVTDAFEGVLRDALTGAGR